MCIYSDSVLDLGTSRTLVIAARSRNLSIRPFELPEGPDTSRACLNRARSNKVMAFFPIPSDLPRTTATVDFIEESRFADVKPYTIAVDELPKEYEDKRTNVVFKPGTINVADLRGYENRLHINDHLVQLVTKRSDWLENNGKDVAENVVSYIKETVDLIKDVTGAEKCICYSYRASCPILRHWVFQVLGVLSGRPSKIRTLTMELVSKLRGAGNHSRPAS